MEAGLTLKPLSLDNLETARLWRNELMAAWRTPYMLTREMQEEYYLNTICNRDSNLRYWGFWIDDDKNPRVFPNPAKGENDISRFYDEMFIGYGGIENIHLENRTGEVSILIGPVFRGGGAGGEALRLILQQAFDTLNLDVVWAECYLCNDSVEWWDKMGYKYEALIYELPYRKYYEGKMYPAKFYYFEREKCASLL